MEGLQLQEIEPPLVIGDSTKVLEPEAVIFVFAWLPNVAVIRPLPSVLMATLSTYLPLIDPLEARPADALLLGKYPLFE